MDIALAGSLAVLALIDSTSFGTLLIPIWLLLNPGRLRVGRMTVYLATVGLFYFAVGIVVALGAGHFLGPITRLLETRPAIWIQLVIGVGLLVFSFRIDSKKARQRRAENPNAGRVGRWRQRALAGDAMLPISLVGLALGAASLEVATMLPYLAAIGLITAAELGAPQTATLLAGYCLVMIAPAAVLTCLRVVARRRIEPVLQRISAWMTKNAAGTTAWVVGIVGFLVARDAAFRLGLFDALGGFGVQVS